MQCISLLFIVLLSCACARFAFSNSWKGLKTVQPSDLVNDASSSITIPAFSKAQHVISTLSNTNITNTVRQVTLLAHSFTTEEFYKICNRISKCKQLEGIVLDGCKLTQEDARSLTQSLRKLSSLRYLSLSHCGIGDEHMTSFCLLAKSPGNITCWDLSDNHLTSESFESLYRILLGSANNTLEKLDLSYNKLGGVLLNLLEETGRKNKLKNIKSFSVKQVGLSGRTCLKLLDVLNSSAPLLQHLDLSGNTLISESSALKQQSSVKNLLSEYTKANSKLLTDALQTLTSSLSTSTSSSKTALTASKKKLLKKRKVHAAAGSSNSKNPWKGNGGGRIKKKKTSIAVVTKAQPASSTRQLLATRLLQTVQQRKLKYIALCKTGLDPKFGQLLAQAADKLPATTSCSEYAEGDCVVDVRLNDINSKEVEAIVKKITCT